MSGSRSGLGRDCGEGSRGSDAGIDRGLRSGWVCGLLGREGGASDAAGVRQDWEGIGK